MAAEPFYISPSELWAMDEEDLQLWLEQHRWWNEEMEKKRKQKP